VVGTEVGRLVLGEELGLDEGVELGTLLLGEMVGSLSDVHNFDNARFVRSTPAAFPPV